MQSFVLFLLICFQYMIHEGFVILQRTALYLDIGIAI